jgi:hypothetical protein
MSFTADAWVGLDGYGQSASGLGGPVVQCGTNSVCSAPINNNIIQPYTVSFVPWWEWAPNGPVYFGSNAYLPDGGGPAPESSTFQNNTDWGFGVAPGDLVEVSLWLATAPALTVIPPATTGRPTYGANFLFVDVTQWTFTAFYVDSPTPAYGYTAEWVMELTGNGKYPVGRFGDVFFDGAWAMYEEEVSAAEPFGLKRVTANAGQLRPTAAAGAFPLNATDAADGSPVIQGTLIGDEMIRCRYVFKYG